ncbi:unnamed protein product [Periconia digitata]|uniref:Uncharacterized protein n=1 Tax=Periconia digitata TaxID=1303443 RepID=A0A9W4U246_9PLEO|nr:unnamed protein product [Periconia digitata]
MFGEAIKGALSIALRHISVGVTVIIERIKLNLQLPEHKTIELKVERTPQSQKAEEARLPFPPRPTHVNPEYSRESSGRFCHFPHTQYLIISTEREMVYCLSHILHSFIVSLDGIFDRGLQTPIARLVMLCFQGFVQLIKRLLDPFQVLVHVLVFSTSGCQRLTSRHMTTALVRCSFDSYQSLNRIRKENKQFHLMASRDLGLSQKLLRMGDTF